MQRHDEEFKKIGVQVVIVAFASLKTLQPYQKIYQWRYPILSDSQRQLYHLLGLQKGAFFQIFHPKTVMNYARYMIEGKKIEKTKEDIYQLGGDFIFDREGVSDFRTRDRAVFREHVAGFTYITRDCNGFFFAAAAQVSDFVIRAVHRGTNQMIHARINADKGLLRIAFDIVHGHEEISRFGDKIASRLK